MHARKCKRALALAGMTALLAVSALSGCGGAKSSASGQGDAQTKAEAATEAQKDLTKDMKEFSTGDGSVSIMLNKDWVTEDLGVDFWLAAQGEKEEKAVLVMQFPKTSPIFAVSGIEDVDAMLTEQYGIKDAADAQAPSIPGMSGVKAKTCTLNSDGETVEAYTIYGETDYAYYALMYMADKMGDDDMESMRASCATFKETPPEVEDNSSIEITDTVKWFNASYAVLTALNGWDYNRFGGLPVNDGSALAAQQILSGSWGVTDKASADDTLSWILTEGHRADFAQEMESLEEDGIGDKAAEERQAFIEEIYGLDEEDAWSYASGYEAYKAYGGKAIDGWDYCRALSLLGFYYTAGYYTDAEALDKSLEIAGTIQAEFGSWDELIDSYLAGYEYWAGESSQDRRDIYEGLKTKDDNPYAVDFNMTLEKTW